MCVKPSLPSMKVVFLFITPVPRVIMKGVLKNNCRSSAEISIWTDVCMIISLTKSGICVIRKDDQYMSYLVSVNLHDRRPSPISTSKISKVTENGSWFWVNAKNNQLANVQPVKYLKFVNLRRRGCSKKFEFRY